MQEAYAPLTRASAAAAAAVAVDEELPRGWRRAAAGTAAGVQPSRSSSPPFFSPPPFLYLMIRPKPLKKETDLGLEGIVVGSNGPGSARMVHVRDARWTYFPILKPKTRITQN